MKISLNRRVALAFAFALFASQSVAADRVRTVNEGGIRDEWMLADGVKLAAPGYPAAFAERGDSVCVAMGYAIKPDGTTSDFVLLKAWASSTQEQEPTAGFWDAFSQTSAAALSQWKFKPRPEISEPRTTFTVATMNFIGKEATDPTALRAHCAIPDLAAFVQQNKANRFQKGTLEKNEMERLRRWQESQRSLQEGRR